MCAKVWGTNTPDGFIGTPRQLGELIGDFDDIVRYDDNSWGMAIPEVFWWEHTKDICLCGIDLRATLTQAGIAWDEDFLAGDLVLVKPLPAAYPRLP